MKVLKRATAHVPKLRPGTELCPPAFLNGHPGTKMPARMPKRAPGPQNTRPRTETRARARSRAQTGAQAPKCPPACSNGRPGTKMPARCAQTGTQAPKINFINKILKRLKKKEEEERRRRKKNKTVYRSRVKAITRLKKKSSYFALNTKILILYIL